MLVDLVGHQEAVQAWRRLERLEEFVDVLLRQWRLPSQLSLLVFLLLWTEKAYPSQQYPSNTLSAGFPVGVHSTVTPQSVIPFLMAVTLLWTGLSNLSLRHYLLVCFCWQQYPNSIDISRKTCT